MTTTDKLNHIKARLQEIAEDPCTCDCNEKTLADGWVDQIDFASDLVLFIDTTRNDNKTIKRWTEEILLKTIARWESVYGEIKEETL